MSLWASKVCFDFHPKLQCTKYLGILQNKLCESALHFAFKTETTGSTPPSEIGDVSKNRIDRFHKKIKIYWNGRHSIFRQKGCSSDSKLRIAPHEEFDEAPQTRTPKSNPSMNMKSSDHAAVVSHPSPYRRRTATVNRRFKVLIFSSRTKK
jgi:hypothetical protein